MANKRVYLDYASTTPIASEVLLAMLPYLKDSFGNASSVHSLGQLSREAIDNSRKQAADFLGCQVTEIIFTSGATESDNLAVFGVLEVAKGNGVAKPHIIISNIEHPAVLEPVKHLEKSGEIEATYLAVDKEGIVKVKDVIEAIRPNTILISVMYANNEIGVIQPIEEIAKAIGNFRKENNSVYPLFHTDAVQAANYLDCDVAKLGVDLLTLSGHKIYGPKGIGALFIKKGVKINPIILGGHQEMSLRGGTENVAGIVAMGEALKQVKENQDKVSEQVKKLRDKLIEGILRAIPKTTLNGSHQKRLPNNANISFSGVEGESILMALDQLGVEVSTGSACASGSLSPSHVLMALGSSHQSAHSSIRFTLGKYTTEKEIDYVLKVLPDIISRLRKLSPLK